ncbi:MAG: hypothetical protein VXA52_07630 [Synechococcus sp.]|jgi:hypothetical protein
MADSPYLVCLALIEQNGQRRLPLGGKGLQHSIAAGSDPGAEGHALALDLLLRLWQQSDDGAIQRTQGLQSLLLLELPMDCFLETLPQLKQAWLRTGNTEALMDGLRQLTAQGWTLATAKFSQPTFACW